jgi:hypothetical protein
MKKVIGFLCLAFPAVPLLAQSSPPDHPVIVDHRLLPKRFPAESMPSQSPLNAAKRSHSNCVSHDPERKSLSVKRCEPQAPAFRLVAPFKAPAPVKELRN